MKVIQPNCRIQFTAQDIEFIARVLAAKNGQNQLVIQLLSDPEMRDLILDDEALFHALLEQKGCLRVSSHFYFYVLVRHVLRRSDIEDRGVADYVAEVLAEFSSMERTRCVVPGRGPVNYMFEMLAALQTADDRTSFSIRAHIGNYWLFFCGVFAEHIRFRAEFRGAPGLSYYEALGRSSFRLLSDHRLAHKYELAPIFNTLSERFEPARRALNDLAERLFSIGDPDFGLDALSFKNLN